MHEHTESLFIEIDKKKFTGENTTTIKGVIYRPPNTDMQLSTEYIEGILETMKSERNICYMMGDYNIDLLKSSVHQIFLEMMYDKSFYNLISRPTRITNATATLIDNIYTNSVSFDKDKFSGVLTSDISDHFMVFCMFQISDTNNNDDGDFYLIRRYSERNKNTFVHSLNVIEWSTSKFKCSVSIFYIP